MRCDVCGREEKNPETLNGAVVGDDIDIRGHRECLDRVQERIIRPNRLRVVGVAVELKEIQEAMEKILSNR